MQNPSTPIQADHCHSHIDAPSVLHIQTLRPTYPCTITAMYMPVQVLGRTYNASDHLTHGVNHTPFRKQKIGHENTPTLRPQPRPQTLYKCTVLQSALLVSQNAILEPMKSIACPKPIVWHRGTRPTPQPPPNPQTPPPSRCHVAGAL